MAEIVKLLINGKIFLSTMKTVEKSEIIRSRLIHINGELSCDEPDRSSKLFEHVLNYMRDRDYPFKLEHKSELDYYKVSHKDARTGEILPEILYDKDVKIMNKLQELITKFNKDNPINKTYKLTQVCEENK